MEYVFGLDTFGDRPALPGAAAGSAFEVDKGNGALMSHPDSIRQVVREGVLADKLGLDIFAIGEHHRPEYAISSPEMVLATLAGLTKNITLASAVTVLSSDDPVRVYERFATLDALSNGRAEVMLGRGSFTESFPLFGYPLSDYELLFEEKLNLLVKLLDEKPVTWSGNTRAALHNQEVFPKTDNRLMASVGVGGSPQSVIRAARYGLPVVFAIIGGSPGRFSRYTELYRRACAQFGTTAHPIGMHSPGFIADTEEEAKELFWPAYKAQHDLIGGERGWPPLTRAQFEQEITHGSLYLGTPETVAQKIAKSMKAVGAQRFEMVYTFGAQAADARYRTVELYGGEVVPRVRELLGES
ncbi:MAG: LLM class flavin-dependent oxidoreductase [Cellulomonadaceae bacterium]|jgi:probable LLM family oxidoreductase|nr:LLM class flavin-dependent oxidoreductase [Cellulomonadaceae bacterium]